MTAAIERLGPADVDAYRRIRLSSLATEPDYFGTPHDTEAARPLADFESRLASSTVLAARAAPGLVGVAHLVPATRPTEAHKASVTGFFVEPAWRGRGIGAALMAELVQIAAQRFEQVTLTVVRNNDAAIALYHRFGFVTYGVEPRARRNPSGYVDDVLMVRLFPGSSVG